MPLKIKRRGLMFVVSSPSGAGKTTIARELLAREQNLSLSISYTTRPIRPGEQEGIDYYFVSSEHFKHLIHNNAFIEYARVFGHYYGTPLRPVEDSLEQGRDILFDIDWQGTQQLKQKLRNDVVSVFVLPPSLKELEKRLLKRAQDSSETVSYRMTQAAAEMSHWPEYDYILINRTLSKTVREAQAILTAERLRRERQLNLPDFVNALHRD